MTDYNTSDFDITRWDDATYDYLKTKCHLDMDSIRLGDEVVPVKNNGKIYFTLNQYFEYCFDHREQLVDHLRQDSVIFNNIYILEIYSLNSFAYIVQINDKRELSFSFENNVIQLDTTMIINSKIGLFSPLSKNEIACFNEFESIPSHIHIYNKFEDGDLKPFQVGLAN